MIDDLDANQVVLGGLSMGADFVLRYALKHPGRVRGLVLAAFPPGPGSRTWALGFADAIEGEGVEAAGAEFVWGKASRFGGDGARWIRRGFLEHSPHALVAILRNVIAMGPSVQTLEPELAHFEPPVLVVVGAEDAISIGPCRALSRALPRVDLVVVEGAGHVVNLAAPARFNTALRAFVDRLSTDGVDIFRG